MKQISIKSAKEGMILGRSIYDENNNCLLKNGTSLTNNLIAKLQNIGCNILCIADGRNTDPANLECLDSSERQNIIKNLKNLKMEDYPNLDYSNIILAANKIMEAVSKNKNIAFDLLDIYKDDNYLYNHAIATSELCIAIARHYQVDNREVFNNSLMYSLAIAALLHNIGYTCKKDAVIKKINTDKFNETDVPIYGYKLLHDALIPNASVISTGILFSKTYENKKNAPKEYAWAIKNSDINHISRIINVASTYNKLIVIGKDDHIAIGPAEAMEMIRDLSGDVFDKNVVNTFVKNIAIYPLNSEVTLSNGKKGIVIANNLGENGFNYRPIVRTYDNNTYNLLINRDITIVPDNNLIDDYIRDETITR